MTTFFVSLSVALVLTLIFAFRFGTWRRPLHVGAYFAGFFALEWAAEAWLLPQGALGVEVAYVCLGLSALFGLAILVTRAMERASDR